MIYKVRNLLQRFLSLLDMLFRIFRRKLREFLSECGKLRLQKFFFEQTTNAQYTQQQDKTSEIKLLVDSILDK